MPVGDYPQRERRVVYTYLVEHQYANLSKLFTPKKTKKLVKKIPTSTTKAAKPIATKAKAGKKDSTKQIKKAAIATKAKAVKKVSTKQMKKAAIATKAKAVKKVSSKQKTKPATKKATNAKVAPARTSAKRPLTEKKRGAGTLTAKPAPKTRIAKRAAKVPTTKIAAKAQLKPKTQRVSIVAAPAHPLSVAPPAALQLQAVEPSITVQTLGGLRKVIAIEPSSTTVAELKHRIQDATGVPTDSQRLIGRGQVLTPDEALLRDVGVFAGAQVYLILRLRGV
jgi:hypothetical protein